MELTLLSEKISLINQENNNFSSMEPAITTGYGDETRALIQRYKRITKFIIFLHIFIAALPLVLSSIMIIFTSPDTSKPSHPLWHALISNAYLWTPVTLFNLFQQYHFSETSRRADETNERYAVRMQQRKMFSFLSPLVFGTIILLAAISVPWTFRMWLFLYVPILSS
jgi:hypothetical protein